MITPLSASQSAGPGPATSMIRNPSAELTKNDFLTLMITQLRNQDPLEPLDQNAFLAQTAQFSSLEQLVNINETLQGLAAGLGPLGAPEASLAQLQQITAALEDVKALLAERVPIEQGSTPSAGTPAPEETPEA